MTSRNKSFFSGWRILIPLVMIWLAMGLRFYRIDAQSFWNDEGNAARLSERSIELIIKGAQMDIHPPGYYLFLHFWQQVAGQSELAQRAFSALCGIVAVAVAIRLGRRAGGGNIGLIAGLLAAFNPLAVYYGQEARMYALLELATALTLWAAVELAEQSPRHWQTAALLAASVMLGLYTQYIYALALVGINLAAGLWWLSRRPLDWKFPGPWLGAQALGAVTFLPWLPYIFKVAGWRPPDLAVGSSPLDLVRAMLVGITLPAEQGWWVMPAAGLLLVLALFAQPRSRFTVWAALGAAVLPALLIAVLGVYRPAYLKFMMAAVVPLAVVLAMAVKRWPVSLLLLCLVVGVQGESLKHLYYDPAYQRDDYRGIAAWIAAEARPGDAIILDAPNQWEVFTYYYRGPLPVEPAPYHPTAEEAAAWIDQMAAEHGRLFVLYWGDTESDPQRYLEGRLAQRAYKTGEHWISRIRVAFYGAGAVPEQPEWQIGAALGPSIMLEGTGKLPLQVRPGDVIPVTLFWRATEAPGQRYKVFIHLVGGGEQPVTQNDSEPGAGFNPTDGWGAETLVADRYGIYVPRDLPPGEYTLWVGMYGFDGQRLPVMLAGAAAGDRVEVGRITVEK